MKKRVTMQTIADHLHISKNSVSQALTGKPGVSEPTRELIKKAAEELGYEYTKGKKETVKHSGSGTIALIASERAFSLNFFGEIYLSIEKEIRANGMSLLIESINEEAIEMQLLPSFIQEGKIDGILILSHLSTDYINKILSTGIPTVLVDHHHPLNPADAVLTNNRFGAYLAIEHLITAGCRTIGYIGNIDISPSYQERWEGYLLAMHKHGLPRKKEWMLTEAAEDESFLTSSLEALSDKPDAWFCVNDGFGFLTMSSLHRLGYKIPDDAAIVSFDNGQLSQLANPKISTMDVDLQLFARKSVEQLFWRMDHKDEPNQEILLPARLIVRESSPERL
ncbi:LacI family DNA-binding transcriptional regulator [Metabacillus sp. GX 13764]|uniref:LacI family DNA-binding transcriptional regulator n=1 Tax=Metabacillus kandeliae TaxID=2900151 RepID=UPI001E5683C8|nr:LacI family DNA-binding transcriptional regulator [Metabacillus kandeliae]MCD7034518.1 LacI family DNA-binding transcriptional regulator [Metabacillus kandeliae]